MPPPGRQVRSPESEVRQRIVVVLSSVGGTCYACGMRDRPPSSYTARRRGFTLLEILAVISILSVLLGIVLGAIHSAQGMGRRAVAHAEVRSVETAFKAYLDHYGEWSLLSLSPTEGGDAWFCLEGDLASALEGAVADDASARAINPDAIQFIEFSRHMRPDRASARRVPVNPWNGRSAAIRADFSGGVPEFGDARFFVAIDANYDGVVDFDRLGLGEAFRLPFEETAADGEEGTDTTPRMVPRPVVVWTYNPDNTRDEAVVSWRE